MTRPDCNLIDSARLAYQKGRSSAEFIRMALNKFVITDANLPHEAVVVVRLDFARVDEFSEEGTEPRSLRNRSIPTEDAAVHCSSKRRLEQLQPYDDNDVF